MEQIRLSKRIAQTGEYSRHEADILISKGCVLLNGAVAVPGTKVPLSGEEIIINGVPLGNKSTAIYKFHKPRGVLSSYADPNGKRNLSSFPNLAKSRLGYAGRLDYDSEGLMLFTSNGDLIYKLQRSEFKVEKEYIAYTNKDISVDWQKKLVNGISDADEQFLPCVVERVDFCKYRVILIEGKKRQVRRMFKAGGAVVTMLQRVRIGSIMLGNLKQGEMMELTKKEIMELEKCIKYE